LSYYSSLLWYFKLNSIGKQFIIFKVGVIKTVNILLFLLISKILNALLCEIKVCFLFLCILFICYSFIYELSWSENSYLIVIDLLKSSIGIN